MIAHRPNTPSPPPEAVARVAAGRELTEVWVNELGGRTFRVTDTQPLFVKWSPSSAQLSLAQEAARLVWAGQYISVPAVVDVGADEDGEWLLTFDLGGESAVSKRWTADPQTAVRAIGQGLRQLHDGLPISNCPFSWSITDRMTGVHRLLDSAAGVSPDDWHEEHRSLTVAQARLRLDQHPVVDQVVVCHGDACAPNTLIADDGSVAGHVDLGSLGLADPWADLAIATWSTHWNYGPGWEDPLLDAYGIERDNERIEYYRLLWDLDA